MINNVIRNISQSNLVNNHITRAVSDDVFAARALVITNVAKDAISYGFRYNKSKKNEEIPEDKRKFVAALDLASGFTTCAVQLLIGFAISNKKLQRNLCNKLFGQLKDSAPKTFDIAKKGFISACALIGSGIIGERVIVPLIATPLASYIKTKLLKEPSPMAKVDYKYYALNKQNKTEDPVFSIFNEK